MEPIKEHEKFHQKNPARTRKAGNQKMRGLFSLYRIMVVVFAVWQEQKEQGDNTDIKKQIS
jgi:hypothetical protein